MKKITLLFSIAITLFLGGCVKDKPTSPHQLPTSDSTPKVWIANEGSLGSGNASLSLLMPQKDSLFNFVFKTVNHQTLGDVFESMTLIGNRLFMAINNSDKIKVIDKNTFKLLGEISVRKPRYLLPIDSTKMYVSSLFYPEINIVNPQTMQVTGKITCDFPNTEGLLKYQGKVYACNWDTACNFLDVIDPTTNQITHRIPIAGYAPQQVLVDKNGHLWVFAGNIEKGKPSTLTCLNPQTGAILKSFHVQANVDILKPVLNKTKDTLYFLGVNYNGGTTYNGVFRMAITDTSLPQQPLIAAQPLQYFWGLGLNPKTGHIFVGDPKGFIQAGDVLVYDTKGHLLKSYHVGLGPGYFLFEP